MSSISLIIDSLKNMITFISLILSHLFHHPRPDFSHKSGRGPTTKSVAARITGNDVGVVMRRLRLPHHEPFSQDSVENIEGIFEGAEPVLEEVREAFRTFDENDDGFVDAEELEKVMSSLGLVGLSQQECERMIMVFDDDGDGRISFGEFVKLIEESFCC
ncbi:probable calcium-binding protein CML46 [Salvia splendens]|uniref:probable calcium-binding protein CML46 n=1 Tax=Salvia splendens TaxID=180675 RepID=UPI001C2795AE|nr:probable calcium-binding protein CML46 [Salvia splendens]